MYPTSANGQEKAYNWLRQNPHRLHLGRIGLYVLDSQGAEVIPEHLTDTTQNLDVWNGLLSSSFTVAGYGGDVKTCCHPTLDAVSFSIGIFQFIWTWNDFFNSMIFINSVEKYTLPLALRMVFDTATVVSWNNVLAMSVLAIIPCILIFFFSQKYFVEGIATSGLKG